MFESSINLEEVILCQTVKEISILAFKNSAISKINLDNVEKIEKYAFYNCQHLSFINVNSVKQFMISSFSGSGLIEFRFPENITYVINPMFSNCFNLETVEGISNLTEIGNNAFEFCAFKNLIFESNLIECKINAFISNTNLESVEFKSVSLEEGVFMNCVNLKTVKIKNWYSSNNGYNFYNCVALEKFKSDGAEEIKTSDFENCRNLTSFNANNIHQLYDACFKNCQSLATFNLTGINYIRSTAFQGCTKLKIIYGLDEENPNLYSVGGYVFSDCINLEIRKIHYAYYGMFSNCYSLKEITFSGSKLKPKAFQFCINLKKFNFQIENNFIESIPEYCFYGCINLEEINFPDCITEIGSFAFYNTSFINGININKVKYLNSFSFKDSKLTSITINKQINLIYRLDTVLQDLFIFDHCDMLKKVIFKGDGFIPLFEFRNCKEFKMLEANEKFYMKGEMLYLRFDPTIYSINISMESSEISIPDDIGEIYFSVFRYAKNIRTIKINHVLRIYSFAFADMASLEEVYYNLWEIPKGCFFNCSKLSKVTLSENVEIIDENAFSHTNLTEIVLPLSLTQIVNPFINTPISKIEFNGGEKHPYFIVTNNEFINNNPKYNKIELLFLFGDISNKITKLSEGINSIDLTNLEFNYNNVILMLPHSIRRIERTLKHYSSPSGKHLKSKPISLISPFFEYPKLCYDGTNSIQVYVEYDDDERIEVMPHLFKFYSKTYPEYYLDFIEVINMSCESNLIVEKENKTKPVCENQQILIDENNLKNGSLSNLEIGLIVVSLLLIGSIACLLYTVYIFMIEKNDDNESTAEMNVEKVTTGNTNEIDGITYDNPLFTRSNGNDDPFKDDFDEKDKIEYDFFLGKDIEEEKTD